MGDIIVAADLRQARHVDRGERQVETNAAFRGRPRGGFLCESQNIWARACGTTMPNGSKKSINGFA